MRITASQLRRIIKEEAQRVLGTRRRAPVRRRRMFEGPDADDADYIPPPVMVTEEDYFRILKRVYGPHDPNAPRQALDYKVLEGYEAELGHDAKEMKQIFFEKTLGTALENCFGWGATPDERPQDAEYLEELVKHIDRELGGGSAATMAEDWANENLPDDPMPVLDFFADLEREEALPQSKAPGITWGTPL